MSPPTTRDAARTTPQLLVVGAACRDIDAADPRGWRLGGGVSYGALLAARLGIRVGAVIGVDGDAATADELGLLSDAGVDVCLVPLDRGAVFENASTPAGRRQVCHRASHPISPVAVPDGWWHARAVLLAPVAGELAEEWADALPRDRVIAVAWQGFLRSMTPGEAVGALPVRPHRVFARADIAAVSAEDLRAGGDDLATVMRTPGQEIVVTAGDGGPLHLRRTASGFDARPFPVVPARDVVDPTGAGDAFLTGWVAARMEDGPFGDRPMSLERSMFVAAALASLAVEGVGLDGVPDAAMFRERLAQLTGVG